MSSFTNKIVVSLEKDGEHWVLEEPFTYYTYRIADDPVYFNIPKGFRTDFASIPKVFLGLPFIKYRDKFNKAAVVHDYLYRIGTTSRWLADYIFLEAMLVLGIPRWKAYIFYLAVRIFASRAWNNSKREREQIKKKLDNLLSERTVFVINEPKLYMLSYAVRELVDKMTEIHNILKQNIPGHFTLYVEVRNSDTEGDVVEILLQLPKRFEAKLKKTLEKIDEILQDCSLLKFSYETVDLD